MNNVETKTFDGLYPDYDAFNLNVVTPLLGLTRLDALPNYLDASKMYYSYESLYTLLSNKYGEYSALNTDTRQHKLMIVALQQLLPSLYVKTLKISNASLAKLSIDDMLKNIERKYNEDADNNYASTETSYGSTPGNSLQSNTFILNKAKEKNIVNRKDNTIRLREMSNLLDKFSDLDNLNASGYIYDFINSIEISSMWQLFSSNENFVVRGVDGTNGTNGTNGVGGYEIGDTGATTQYITITKQVNDNSGEQSLIAFDFDYGDSAINFANKFSYQFKLIEESGNLVPKQKLTLLESHNESIPKIGYSKIGTNDYYEIVIKMPAFTQKTYIWMKGSKNDGNYEFPLSSSPTPPASWNNVTLSAGEVAIDLSVHNFQGATRGDVYSWINHLPIGMPLKIKTFNIDSLNNAYQLTIDNYLYTFNSLHFTNAKIRVNNATQAVISIMQDAGVGNLIDHFGIHGVPSTTSLYIISPLEPTRKQSQTSKHYVDL